MRSLLQLIAYTRINFVLMADQRKRPRRKLTNAAETEYISALIRCKAENRQTEQRQKGPRLALSAALLRPVRSGI